MTRLKIGDRVRLKDTSGYRADQWVTIEEVEDDDYTGDMTYFVRTDDHAGFWPSDDQIDFDSLERKYDQYTVNAILRHLRGRGITLTAQILENEFAKPETRTVAAEFQVPVGKSLTDYLESVGIDYDITGGN